MSIRPRPAPIPAWTVSAGWSICSGKTLTRATQLERIQHGYDRAGNRLWRQCPVATAAGRDCDELYGYDGQNQLKLFQRGQLDSTQTGLVPGSQGLAQAWTFDATGNWDRIQAGDNGMGVWNQDLPQTYNPPTRSLR